MHIKAASELHSMLIRMIILKLDLSLCDVDKSVCVFAKGAFIGVRTGENEGALSRHSTFELGQGRNVHWTNVN
jgi:hypothetical protein